jgi:uncharacterized membrane protein YfcA
MPSGARGALFRDMLLLLAIVLAVAWVVGFGVYHVAAATIHLLLIFALLSLLLYFLRGSSSTRRLGGGKLGER